MSIEALPQTEKYILSSGSIFDLLRRSSEVVYDEHIYHAGLIYNEQKAEVLERVN